MGGGSVAQWGERGTPGSQEIVGSIPAPASVSIWQHVKLSGVKSWDTSAR